MAVFTWKQAFAPLPSRRSPCSTTRGFGIIKQKHHSLRSLKNSLRTVSDYLITYLIQKLARGHVFLSEALFWPEWRVNLKGCDVAKILSGRACSHKENRRDSTKARRANPSYWGFYCFCLTQSFMFFQRTQMRVVLIDLIEIERYEWRCI